MYVYLSNGVLNAVNLLFYKYQKVYCIMSEFEMRPRDQEQSLSD